MSAIDMKTYMAWWTARRRCQNPRDGAYRNYGGRGIEMKWESYAAFVKDMGLAPAELWLDRTDNDGHYELGNCCWVSPKASARNRRNNAVLTVRGKSASLAEWAEQAGIKHRTMWMRLHRHNWTAEEAVGLVKRPRKTQIQCRNGHLWAGPGYCPECRRLCLLRYHLKGCAKKLNR